MISEDIVLFLVQNPEATGRDLARAGLVSSARTGRRRLAEYRRGCTPQVISQRMLDLEDEEEFDLDEFLAWAPKEVALQERLDPIMQYDTYDFKTDQPVAVIFVSCMHLGGRYTRYDEFKDLFDAVLKIPRLYWGSLGDDIEGFTAWFRDVKAVQDQIINVDRQMLVLEHVLKRLKDDNRLLFGTSSQHGGDWEVKRTGRNPVKQLYLDMKVPFYDGFAYVDWLIGGQVYKVALAHQFKGYSMYNPNHPQTRALRYRFPNADLVVMGDKHMPSIQQMEAYTDEYMAGNRESSMVTLLQVGTAKTGPDLYTMKGGWSHGVLGWPVMLFMPDKHEIRWEWHGNLERVQEWLKI